MTAASDDTTLFLEIRGVKNSIPLASLISESACRPVFEKHRKMSVKMNSLSSIPSTLISEQLSHI